MRYTNHGLGLNLFEAGQGEKTLLFLHYFGGSARTWQPVIARLAESHRCLALDLRGWGESDAPLEGAACRVEDMVGDVHRVVSELGQLHYTLIGHSMGGKVAQAFAAAQPPGLNTLLLVAPSPLTPEPMTNADRAGMRAAYGSAAAARLTLEKIACLPLTPALTDSIIADNLRASRIAWEAWADIGSREDLSALAPHITAPTFVLAGAGDVVLSPDILQREVVSRLPHVALTVVPEAGHLLPLETPETVADWIRKYA